MDVQLNYGKKQVAVSLPQNINWHVLKKDLLFPPQNEGEIIENAVHSLVEQMDSKVQSGSKILIIIPDHTRRCRIDLILPFLINAFDKMELQYKVLVANGSHVVQPEKIIKDEFGIALWSEQTSRLSQAAKTFGEGMVTRNSIKTGRS